MHTVLDFNFLAILNLLVLLTWPASGSSTLVPIHQGSHRVVSRRLASLW